MSEAGETATTPATEEGTPDDVATRIRAGHERRVAIVTRRPERAIGTAVTHVTVTEGITCEVVEGDYRHVVDMPERYGGGGRGPDPGVYGRAALGSCLAISYASWAAQMDLPIRRLEIEIQADYDARGELGVNDEVTPAYTAVRYIVTVETDAPEEEVRRVFDYSDEKCPYLHVWADPMDMRRELRISRPGDAAADGSEEG